MFLCLKEMNTHFENLDVSFSSFCKSFFVRDGFISINKEYLFFDDLSKSFKSGIGFLF